MSNENFTIKGTVTVIKNKGRADEKVICKDKPNLLTIAGRDYIHNAIYVDESASKVAASFIGLSEDTNAPVNTDTTLAGEFDNTNGLGRANADSNTHTASAITSVISHVFTATGTQNNVQKTALFTAISGGTMVHENTFTPEDLANTDTLTVTWTITAQ